MINIRVRARVMVTTRSCKAATVSILLFTLDFDMASIQC